jgi:hypothetical protein
MELDGREVAVVAQKVYESATAEFAGWMPLAVLLGDDEVRRLRDASGEPTRAVPAEGHEGAA